MRPILALIAVTIAGIMLLAACNSAEQRNQGTASAPASAPPSAPAVFADGVRRVTPAELHDLLNRNEAVVVDVRTMDAFNTAHIRGARLIPEAEVGNRSNELPKNKLIVTYCA